MCVPARHKHRIPCTFLTCIYLQNVGIAKLLQWLVTSWRRTALTRINYVRLMLTAYITNVCGGAKQMGNRRPPDQSILTSHMLHYYPLRFVVPHCNNAVDVLSCTVRKRLSAMLVFCLHGEETIGFLFVTSHSKDDANLNLVYMFFIFV